MGSEKISRLFTFGKTTVCIAVQRFSLLDKRSDRYSTCLKIGYDTIDRNPYRGGANQYISVNCYCWPEEPYVFNHVPISNRLNVNFDAGLTKLQAARKWGPLV